MGFGWYWDAGADARTLQWGSNKFYTQVHGKGGDGMGDTRWCAINKVLGFFWDGMRRCGSRNAGLISASSCVVAGWEAGAPWGDGTAEARAPNAVKLSPGYLDADFSYPIKIKKCTQMPSNV